MNIVQAVKPYTRTKLRKFEDARANKDTKIEKMG
jgi:hypothetical protein